MHKNNHIEKLGIIWLLLFVGWCLVVVLFTDFDHVGFYYWGGFGFGILTFIATGVSLLRTQMIESRNTTEINYLPVYITAVYFVISMLVNTYFVFRRSGKFNVILATVDLVLFIVFVSVRLYTNEYVERVDEQTRYSAQKVKPVAAISSTMSVLLSIAADEEIKRKLLELKQLVDYSSNISQKSAEDDQNLFLQTLEQIQSMIREKKDKEDTIQKIQEATMIWKTRNSKGSNN